MSMRKRGEVLEADFYTSISQAKYEIRTRLCDDTLLGKVRAFLDDDIPGILLDGPYAILARHVATPNKETSWFLNLAEAIALKHVFLEYQNDMFTSRNPSKYHLGKLVFRDGFGESCTRTTEEIFDLDKSEGGRIHKISTSTGVNLIDFHHELLQRSGVDPDDSVFDMSKWYTRHGKVAKEYYRYFFSLFICHGVLFENFLIHKGEKDFFYETVVPAFYETWDRFGVKPIIVPLMPLEYEEENIAYHYDSPLKQYKGTL